MGYAVIHYERKLELLLYVWLDDDALWQKISGVERGKSIEGLLILKK